MKILIVSSVFPPKIIGGAELSAYNLGVWLSQHGHEIGVLTVAEEQADELHGELVNGLRIWRLCSPHIHTQHTHRSQAAFRKFVWHIQDHFDPRNKTALSRVIEEFKPDSINVHVIQGLGHNALAEVAGHNIPVVYFLHDLGLACFRQSLYKRDANCDKQCFSCHLSSLQKMKHLNRLHNLQFVSPSRANLETLQRFVDLRPYAAHVVPNLDLDNPVSEWVCRHAGSPVRFLYVGKIDKPKGVEFMLKVLDAIACNGKRFTLTIVGGGPSAAQLREQYANRTWLTFAGKVPPSKVRSFMERSDALLLPSLWRENHPGVVRQALRTGVPAIVSDAGGSQEMIRNGDSGMVSVAGDEQSWMQALGLILEDEAALLHLQEGARKAGLEYSVDALGERLLELISTGVSNAKTTSGGIVSGQRLAAQGH